MQPTLRPGDRLLVGTWLRVRAGDVVVFRDPEARSKLLVKRVSSFTSHGDAIMRGDNPNVSRDSREFGAVSPQLWLGRVVYRYLPGERRGRL
jgi:nickel-type superoxide dismutase maturation protease